MSALRERLGVRALRERLRPHPHRGDVIAAGAVPLALAVLVIELRMTQWGVGVRFVVVALVSALLLSMAWLAPLEGEAPRPYHSVLVVSGLLPLLVSLELLAESLGSERPAGAGGQFWIWGIEAGVAAAAARRANSAICTLIAAVAAGVALEAFVIWVFQPDGLGALRGIAILLLVVFVAGAVRQRDGRRAHAVALVDAAGIVTVVLGLSLLGGLVVVVSAPRGIVSGAATAGFGWKLYLLAVGFGLIAYGAADRERGPAYLGVLLLGVFALLVGLHPVGRGSLVGWPLFLLVIGGAGLAIGLRPRRPLPPPPRATEPAPTVPFEAREKAT